MQFTLVSNDDGTENLTVYGAGKKSPLTAHSTHPNYQVIRAGVLAADESVYGLFDVALTAATKFERLSDRITVANGLIYLDGEPVANAVAQQIARFLREGVEDWKPLVSFFEKIQSNPNEHSREQLYGWLQAGDFTITEDGMIVGYKGVYRKGKSFESSSMGRAIVNDQVHVGRIPNPLGAVVEMPRSEVVHNPGVDCSVGLHVATYAFAKNFLSSGDSAVLEVLINPRDVVSVPRDASAAKMRVCRYTVVKVAEQEYKNALKPKDKPKLKTKTKTTTTTAKKKAEVRPVKVGDVYQDTDKRRTGVTFKVTGFDVSGNAIGKSLPRNITRVAKVERLLSSKYKLVKKGR